MQTADVKTIIPRLTFARVVVFWSSFSMMVVEIAASHVMAPFLGVSLYTWTSVIGSVLLGVSIGSAVGGRLADRVSSFRPVSKSLATAALFVVAMPFLARHLGPAVAASSLPLWAATFVFCGVVFFPAAFLLSLVPPVVARSTLKSLAEVGSTVGGIGLWGSIGSIAGTFIAGFLLVQYVPTSDLLYATAAGLLLMSVAVIRATLSSYGNHRE